MTNVYASGFGNTLVARTSKCEPKWIAAYAAVFMVLASPTTIAHTAAEKRGNVGATGGGWSCNAYGYDRHWKTVTGSRKASKIEAQSSAMLDCRRALTACRLTGCWPS